MIDERQVQQFKTFGFLVLRNIFTGNEQRAIRAEFDHRAAIASSYKPFDGTTQYNINMMVTLPLKPRPCRM